MDLQENQTADEYAQQNNNEDNRLYGAAGEQFVFAAVILDARPDCHVATAPR